MRENFWHGKRVLVTGHSGFKGNWLVNYLQMLDAEVHGVSLPGDAFISYCDPGKKNFFESNIDIRDADALRRIVFDVQPDIVFHLAAQSIVKRSTLAPFETYSTNIQGTVNLLEAITGIKKHFALVNVTSDKCYLASVAEHVHSEHDPLGGNGDPYSVSKAAAELITWSFNRYRAGKIYGESGIVTCRGGNVIGGGDFAEDRLIPDVCRSVFEGIPIRIRNPMAVRPWQHVLDAIRGYLVVARKLYEKPREYSGPWNFGPDRTESLSVQEIIDQIKSRYEIIEDTKSFNRSDVKFDAPSLLLDSTKAKTKLGWRPMLTTLEAIQLTLEWYEQYYKRPDYFYTTRRQIIDYHSRI